MAEDAPIPLSPISSKSSFMLSRFYAVAERAAVIPDRLVYYRQDNDMSSVRSAGKIFCVCDEYREMEAFLKREGLEELETVVSALKFNTYIWNYERLTEESALEFLLVAREELLRDMNEGRIKRGAFPFYKWNTLNFILRSPEEFHRIRQEEKRGEKFVHESERSGGVISRGFRLLKENGLFYTLRRLVFKLGGRRRTR